MSRFNSPYNKELNDKIGDLSTKKADKTELTSKADATYVDTELAKKTTKTYVDQQITNIGSATPKGTYATLSALQTAFPAGTTGIYLVTADGKWYYWSGSAWVAGGVYQSTVISDGSVTPEKTDFINLSVNLFNKYDPTIVPGYYIKNTGDIAATASLFYTGHIKVEKGNKYIIPKSASVGDTSCGAYYDASGNFVAGVTGVSTADNLYRIITVPDNSAIRTMKVNYQNSLKDTFMVVKGEVYPSEYFPYYKSLGIGNPLYNKIVSYNGDSIAAGQGFTGGYGLMIAKRNAMTYENRSVSGGTIASGTYKTDGTTARHWICRDIINMRSDADYIILEGSVNDVSLSVPLGTITPDFTSTFNDATFCDAFESMLKQAVLKFPGKKIGFVIVHRLWMDASSFNFHNGYYPAIKQMCEKWSIPYCDLYKGVPSLNLIPELKTAYTKDGDGWHPNEAGYNAFYVDKIESWMKTL